MKVSKISNQNRERERKEQQQSKKNTLQYREKEAASQTNWLLHHITCARPSQIQEKQIPKQNFTHRKEGRKKERSWRPCECMRAVAARVHVIRCWSEAPGRRNFSITPRGWPGAYRPSVSRHVSPGILVIIAARGSERDARTDGKHERTGTSVKENASEEEREREGEKKRVKRKEKKRDRQKRGEEAMWRTVVVCRGPRGGGDLSSHPPLKDRSRR